MKLPESITEELGKSPHQYFIAGMEATNFVNNGGKVNTANKKQNLSNIKKVS